jgi:hypothetical protein
MEQANSEDSIGLSQGIFDIITGVFVKRVQIVDVLRKDADCL